MDLDNPKNAKQAYAMPNGGQFNNNLMEEDMSSSKEIRGATCFTLWRWQDAFLPSSITC